MISVYAISTWIVVDIDHMHFQILYPIIILIVGCYIIFEVRKLCASKCFEMLRNGNPH